METWWIDSRYEGAWLEKGDQRSAMNHGRYGSSTVKLPITRHRTPNRVETESSVLAVETFVCLAMSTGDEGVAVRRQWIPPVSPEEHAE